MTNRMKEKSTGVHNNIWINIRICVQINMYAYV